MVSTATLTESRISADIAPWRSNWLTASISWSGLLARGSQGERSMDVPVGRFGAAAGMFEKITLFAKLARLSEVSEEKIPNCGPSEFSPGTLAVAGEKIRTDGS